LEVLRVSAHRLFAEPQDRDLADEADAQGVGGSQSASRRASVARTAGEVVRSNQLVSSDKAAIIEPGSARVGSAE